jgi:hypothetical protein
MDAQELPQPAEDEDLSRKEMLKRAFQHTSSALTRAPSLRELELACPSLSEHRRSSLVSASASILAQVHSELLHHLSLVLSRPSLLQSLAELDSYGPPPLPFSSSDQPELSALPGGPDALLRAARVRAKRFEADHLQRLLDEASASASAKEAELNECEHSAHESARHASRAFEPEYQAFLTHTT